MPKPRIKPPMEVPLYPPALHRICFLPTILLAKVPSVVSKVDELEVVADTNNADVTCLTESWLNLCVHT